MFGGVFEIVLISVITDRQVVIVFIAFSRGSFEDNFICLRCYGHCGHHWRLMITSKALLGGTAWCVHVMASSRILKVSHQNGNKFDLQSFDFFTGALEAAM